VRTINEIIIHCAATRPEWGADQSAQWKRDQIDKWHRDRGWAGIGYHYVIDRDGTVVEGRPLAKVGAHVQGHNANSIGVCLIGGHGSSATDAFLDNYTLKQDVALRGLLAQFPHITKITGHNDYTNAKACPGFKVSEWLTKKPRSVVKSTTVQASAVQIASAVGTAGGAVGMLDGTAQIVALVFAGVIALTALWVMRERLKKWADGVR
jgi:hypothetical protein